MLGGLTADLHREIVRYVPLSDQLHYARINRMCCHELMVEVRRVALSIYEVSEDFLKKRDSILKAIENPYFQLSLDFLYVSKEVVAGEEDWNISLRSLCIDIRDFMRFRPRINHLQHLTLSFEEDDTEDYDEEELRLTPIGAVLDEVYRLPGLKEIHFNYLPDLPQPPMIPQLQRLKILRCARFNATDVLQLRNLQFLKLEHCSEISDVRCLDHIYELHLINCPSVRDISGLNHNSIIHIDSCPIRDYNGSFQFSRVIRLCAYSGEPMNLDRLERVQSLTIYCDGLLSSSLPLDFSKDLPSLLRHLELKDVVVPFSLPRHHRIRALVIYHCDNFSLENLDDISYIKITNSCHNRADWSALNNRSKVEIAYCPSFQSSEELNNVKELVIVGHDVSHMLNLRYVTHLKLSTNPYHFLTPSTISLLTGEIHLKEIQFSVYNSSLDLSDKTFLTLLKNYTFIKRIVINQTQYTSRNFKGKDLKIIDGLLGDDFYVERLLLTSQIVLSRKDNRKENNEISFPLMIRTGFAFLIMRLLIVASLFKCIAARRSWR